jgi:Phospholipase_D-nuclease N-terminal
MVAASLFMYLRYLLYALWIALLIAAVVDCLKSNNQNKVGWIAVIVLMPLLGAYLYFRFAQGRFVSEL